MNITNANLNDIDSKLCVCLLTLVFTILYTIQRYDLLFLNVGQTSKYLMRKASQLSILQMNVRI